MPSRISDKKIRVFTTRIDTIYGATAIVLAAEHPLLAELLEGSSLKADVSAFAEKTKAARAAKQDPTVEEEKEGLNTGALAINPFSGESLPVWVANYVLMEYGTGAVMSVPAHDERDFEFAQKYTLADQAGDCARISRPGRGRARFRGHGPVGGNAPGLHRLRRLD